MVTRLTRRALLAAGGASGLAALAVGQDTNDNQGNLYGGTMALEQAYNVAGDLWIGPDSAKSDVDPSDGRVYMAADTEVEYYGDGDAWVKLGVGTEGNPVPQVTSESVSTERLQDDAEQPWVSGRLSGQQKNQTNYITPLGLDYHKRGVVLSATESYESSDPGITNFEVVWDHNKQRWAALYTAFDGTYNSINLAWSNDLYNWEKYSSNPVFKHGVSGEWDDGGVKGAFVWEEGGTYYMYYNGADGTGNETGSIQEGLATSPDLINWTRHSNNPILSTSSSGWRAEKIYKASVVRENDTYHMFVNAKGDDGKERIGHATAAAPDGSWAWDTTNNPIIDVGDSGAWDSEIVGDPYLIRHNDQWVMHYFGFDGNLAQEGVATTTPADYPYNWTKHPTNPVLKPGPTSIDSSQAHKPVIVHANGEVFHFYITDGGGDNLKDVALATTSRTPTQATMDIPSSNSTSKSRDITATSYTTVGDTEMLLDGVVSGANGDYSSLMMSGIYRVTLTDGETGYLRIKWDGTVFGEVTFTGTGGYQNIRMAPTQLPTKTGDALRLGINAKVSGGTLTVANGEFTVMRQPTQ